MTDDAAPPARAGADPGRRALLVAGAAALLTAPARAAIPIPLPFGGRKRPAVDPADVARSTGAPAAGGAVVTPKGVLFLAVGGRRRIDDPQPVAKGDSWHIGSNTKALTSALYARQVEAGRTSWSATIPALFPDIKPHPAWTDVRIDDVLAHRAGLTDTGAIDADWLSRAAADPRPPRAQRTELAQQLLSGPPPLPPGGFEYANLNYALAGAALERLTDSPWEAAMTDGLFRPLGMTSAGFGPPRGAAPWGHRLGEDRRLHAIDPAGLADFPAVLAPATGVHLSLSDYARFVRLFLNDGGGYLKPDTLTRMARPWGGQEGDYGLGWRVLGAEGWAKGPVLSQEGSNTLWHAQAQVAPGRGLAVIAVANAETGGGVEAARRLSLELIQAYA